MNIELHGFDTIKGRKIKKEIWDRLCGKPEGKDALVTVVSCDTEDCNSRDLPFVRVFSDRQEDFVFAVGVLRGIPFYGGGMKVVVEYVLLHSCIEI